MADDKTLAQQLWPAFALHPLRLFGVADRGLPGKERIYLKTFARVNLGEYLLLIGQHIPNDAIPIRDNLFWFGTHAVDEGHWIVVYTGPGLHSRSTTIEGTGEPALVFHWGKETTAFERADIVPVLVHIDGTGIQISHS